MAQPKYIQNAARENMRAVIENWRVGTKDHKNAQRLYHMSRLAFFILPAGSQNDFMVLQGMSREEVIEWNLLAWPRKDAKPLFLNNKEQHNVS